MSRLDENIFGRIAVFHGFLRREQLKECLEEERSAAEGTDLGHILLRKGYLTEEQVGMIREIRRKKARKMLRDLRDIEQSERSFGQIALRKGLIGLRELEEALLEQDRLSKLNLQFRLGEVLVALGRLAADQVVDVLNEQGKRILQCPSCDYHYSVHNYPGQKDHRCKQCGDALVEPLFLDPVAVDGVIGGVDPEGDSLAAPDPGDAGAPGGGVERP